MTARTIAIGDIHGCAAALRTILSAIRPVSTDTVVILGDYIDRGPDSRQVIDDLIELSGACRLITLLGNHEEMLLMACQDETELLGWLEYGGAETLASYDAEFPSKLPAAHRKFIEAGVDFHETADCFLVHANYLADVPLDQQPASVLRWLSLWERTPGRHVNGKTAIVAHTAQKSGEIFDLGYLKCIDTYCHGGGWLTALELQTGQVWQADRQGRMRAPSEVV